MRIRILSILIWLFCGETLFASRTYDSFEGGKIVCHQEELQSGQSKEYFFRSDFSAPFTDKQTKFKPTQIQLMTSIFQKEGFFLKARKLTEIEDLKFYYALGEEIILCGERLSKSEIARCSYMGGDDSTESPEMIYIINCGKWRLQMEIFHNKELQVDCSDNFGKVIFAQKFLSCTRSQ